MNFIWLLCFFPFDMVIYIIIYICSSYWHHVAILSVVTILHPMVTVWSDFNGPFLSPSDPIWATAARQLLDLALGIGRDAHGQQTHQVVDQRDAGLADVHRALLLGEQQPLQQPVYHRDGRVQEDPTNALPVFVGQLGHIHHLRSTHFSDSEFEKHHKYGKWWYEFTCGRIYFIHMIYTCTIIDMW